MLEDSTTVHAVSHCSHCGERLRRAHIHLEPGPGDPDLRFLPGLAPATSTTGDDASD